MNIEQFRARLQIEQRETVEAIEQAQQSAAPVELDQSSVGRVSRIDALQQQALALGLLERLTVRKRKVEAALARLDAGTYGMCCACQGDVEPERLNADPAVVFCQECKKNR
ncbi:MAG: molecular chaperone DnaK [Hydrogenophaga sp.]|jgi:DnaK suppressor protein|uniref:TraR/DksA family transcriptional regulator n=1 Tax=Hydrogenophaga sp. TaxID=1904254 RepID=UPI002636EAE5|nr:molecular chaperone DnaK [Hydrogenophaga sp.]MDD3786677.1 molecular chaperone DnaK [Hydrogenophaga sp.]